MTRYAVGDLQGCLDPLRQLLERVGFDPAQDQLWSTGDLVNRGPQSLECLRFLRDLGDSLRVVLGNHDLHLLALAEGIRPLKRGDTLGPVLDAPDCAELLAWLERQPLFHRDPSGDFSMVHAGLAPQWSLADAQQLSNEIGTLLRGPRRRDYLEGMYGDTPAQWDPGLSGPTRWRVATNFFTRLRLCDADGRANLKFKEGPERAPAGQMPWFDVPGRRSAGAPIIFGHWAALMGRAGRDDVVALDTGCVWGQHLTLYNLDDGSFHCCACDAPKTKGH